MQDFLLKKELKQLYQFPGPERKQEFIRTLNYPKTTWRQFVITQTGYVHKAVWILSLLLVLLAVMAGNRIVQKETAQEYELLWFLSAVMPILAVMLVLETFRSGIYEMEELELSCRHNLPQVLLVRMGVIAAVDFLLICLVIPVLLTVFFKQEMLAGNGIAGYLRTTVYLLVPYLLTCALTFLMVERKSGRETVWYGMAAGFLVCGISVISRLFAELIYQKERFYIWMLAFLFLTVLIGKQVRNIRKGYELKAMQLV